MTVCLLFRLRSHQHQGGVKRASSVLGWSIWSMWEVNIYYFANCSSMFQVILVRPSVLWSSFPHTSRWSYCSRWPEYVILLRNTVTSREMSMWPKQKESEPFLYFGRNVKEKDCPLSEACGYFYPPHPHPWSESTQESRTKRWKGNAPVMSFKSLDSAMHFAPHMGPESALSGADEDIF